MSLSQSEFQSTFQKIHMIGTAPCMLFKHYLFYTQLEQKFIYTVVQNM